MINFKPTYEQIVAAYKKKGYKFYTEGNYNINFFGIRKDNILDNKFSDTLGMAFKVSGQPETVIIPGTTCPGLYGGRAAMNPRPGGVAIICPGQYIGVWEFVDDYVTWLKYPFFRQVGTFKIWRDGDKDTIVDQVNEQLSNNDGLNCHRMSWDGVIGQQALNNWSEGCQGAEEPHFKKLLPPVRACVQRYGYKLTYTLFMESDFQ
jgi:hypothetical protein